MTDIIASIATFFTLSRNGDNCTKSLNNYLLVWVSIANENNIQIIQTNLNNLNKFIGERQYERFLPSTSYTFWFCLLT